MFKDFSDTQKNGQLSKRELADKVAALRLPKILGVISKFAPQVMIFLIWGSSSIFAIAIFDYIQSSTGFGRYFLYGILPFAFVLSFVLVAGLFGQLGRFGVIEGKFPRIPEHPVYALRRIFGGSWTQVFYFKPIYSLCLSIPVFKKLLFKLFGYKGSMNFTVYPDSWIRDLPLLSFGSGAYLANRCTLGTNICLEDNTIIVGPITFKEHSVAGHLAVVSLGTRVGEHSMLGEPELSLEFELPLAIK
jgi:hypothetical protein